MMVGKKNYSDSYKEIYMYHIATACDLDIVCQKYEGNNNDNRNQIFSRKRPLSIIHHLGLYRISVYPCFVVMILVIYRAQSPSHKDNPFGSGTE